MRSGKSQWAVALAVTALLLSGCEFSFDGGAISADKNKCAEFELDLAETELGLWLHSGRISTGTGDAVSFRIKENQFDPCAELSWVSIETIAHDKNAFPELNWDTANVAVLFFHYDHLISNASVYAAPKLGAVTVDNKTISVEYFQSRDGDAFQVIESKLKGETLEQQEPMRLRILPLTLEFHKSPPPTESTLGLYGNAKYQPWDEVLELDGYNSPVVSVPMGDRQITCSFPGSNAMIGPNLVCSDRSVSWPLVVDKKTQTKSPVNSKGKTNTALIDFGIPANMYTRYNKYAGSGVTSYDLPDEALVKAGGFYIDTTGDTVKVGRGLNTVILGVGKAELLSEPLIELDTSRHPTNLAEWSD